MLFGFIFAKKKKKKNATVCATVLQKHSFSPPQTAGTFTVQQVTARMANTVFQTAMKPLYVFPFVLMNVCTVQSAVSNVCLLKI